MATQAPLPRRPARFYRAMALLALLIVLVGFSRSFYLKFLFHVPPPLTLLLVVHGIIMTSWFVLFIVQAQLVANRNVRLHRKLGVAGVALAALVLLAGTTVAILGARAGHSPGPPPLVFLVVPLGDMALFATLVGSAFLLRHRPEYHKRLMLLAFIGLLTAAVARMPWVPKDILMPLSMTVVIAAGCVVYDTWKHRRLHPAFGWGLAALVLSWPLRLGIAGTAGWQAFASWLTS